MRELIVLQGPAGCGKSYFTETQGLSPYTLSSDTIRLIKSGAVASPEGGFMIDQSQAAAVWQLLFECLDERMGRGELVVVDATHTKSSELERYRQLARKYRYRCTLVQFPFDRETLRERNEHTRPPYRKVPMTSIDRMIEELSRFKAPSGMRVIRPGEIREVLNRPPRDLAGYKRVIHIGDIHGVYSALLSALDAKALDPDVFYVFHGDYIDRGPENAKVLAFVEHYLYAPNVAFLRGNHELHLWRFAEGMESVSNEFERITRPELERHGFAPERVGVIFDAMLDGMVYRTQAEQGRTISVLCTHAGLSFMPSAEEMALVPSWQMIKGVGNYGDPVHQWWDRNTGPTEYQVHGHRNTLDLPHQASERCINLEDQVEFGGGLRTVAVSAQGFSFETHRCTEGLDSRERRGRGAILRAHYPEIKDDCLISEQMTEKLEASSYVRVKDFGSVRSYAFTPKAFYKGVWDDVTVKARGLFVDPKTRRIISRGYDKFFNIGEREETQIDRLAEDLVYPVTVYLKENGFLGIAGYHEEEGRLFLSSKSTPEGEFASWFREILGETLGPVALERFGRYLRDAGVTAVFEVIDPERDPHLVRYASRKVVLLDLIRRSESFEKLPFDAVKVIAKRFRLEHKERVTEIKDDRALVGWYKQASSRKYSYRGQEVEGFVLEDAAGRHVKVKCFAYGWWKKMRSVKDRLIKAREKGLELPTAERLGLTENHQRQVLEFMLGLLDEGRLDQPILEIKALFEKTSTKAVA
ncbi:RNA ligase [Thioalkalivibrio thiocyanodenitrificans]|uniref:RNA ligase n=1 Tax=Thioalkalivibrio thiocyanodenitrificans TaxID=243063 RepID=UPI000362EEC3|nr:RNA ligase [Thioalkalivibrio thiocyanodenitrificans]